MLFAVSILIYIAIGATAGVAGALLGIGGGSITVPLLLITFSFLGFPKEHIMHVAIGTSLSAMVINTLSASFFHNRKSAVSWTLIKRILPGIIFGSFAGAFIAKETPSTSLQFLFGVFACLIGLLFSKPLNVDINKHQMPKKNTLLLIGFAVACLSNLLGIGGGFFMVPILLYYHFNERKAIGTSSTTSFFISLGGALGYLLSADSCGSITGCYGYIYVPAFFTISLSSLCASFFGVKLAHSLPPQTLRKIFSVFMIAVGLYMVLS